LVVVWRTVRKHRSTALLTMLAVMLLTVFYTAGQTKIYEAKATVELDPNPPSPLGKGVEAMVDMGAGNYWNNREYYETQYKILASMRVSLAVVEGLGLTQDEGYVRRIATPGAAISDEQVAEYLIEHLTVAPVKESRLVVLRYEDPNPDRAQRILAKLVEVYTEQNLENVLSSTNSAVDWLRGQLDHLRQDLEASEMGLHQFKLENKILSVAIDDQSNMLREEMKQLNEALTTVRTKRGEVAARLRELNKVSSLDPAVLPSSELLASPVLQALRKDHAEAIRLRETLLAQGKGLNHPETAAATAAIAACRSTLLAEVKNIQGAVAHDLSALQSQEGTLSDLFERANKKALDLNLSEIEYTRLRRAKENNEKVYSMVLERTKEGDLTRMLRVNNVHVIDRPLLPRFPVRPRVPFNIAFGAFAGLVLSIMAAMGRALLDRSVKTPVDVETELGMTFLGLLPEMGALSKTERQMARRRRAVSTNQQPRELLVHYEPNRGVAEAARAIRTNLTFMAPDHPYKTLLITSSGPSEGKTTVACWLAIAMAQAGQRVLLMDCDLRRPRLHRIFGTTGQAGVTTAMLADELPDMASLATVVPNLYALPAGPTPPNPSEILHSEKFKQLLARLQDKFDRIIIDSPPVVPVTDATILSTQVDGTIFVVRAYGTSKDLARQGLRLLTDVGAHQAGVVLNAVDLNRYEYHSYYYAYHREGYYAAKETPRSRDEKALSAKPIMAGETPNPPNQPLGQ
jgi:capsular exopolysaccharide synthesis family protein